MYDDMKKKLTKTTKKKLKKPKKKDEIEKTTTTIKSDTMDCMSPVSNCSIKRAYQIKTIECATNEKRSEAHKVKQNHDNHLSQWINFIPFGNSAKK